MLPALRIRLLCGLKIIWVAALSAALLLHASTAFQTKATSSLSIARGYHASPAATLTFRPKNSGQLQALPNPLPDTVDPVVWSQLALSGTLGVATDPLVEAFLKPQLIEGGNVKTTFVYGAADSFSNAARVYFGTVLFFLLQQIFGVELVILPDSAASALTVAFTIWIALTVSSAKRFLFHQNVSGNRLGRVELYDQLIDFILFVITSAVVLDELDFEIGMAFQSAFAASGVGAIAFSLASKDLAQHIVSGVILQAWDAFEIGDDVRLGDGTEGTIRKIGLVETQITGFDNIIIKIPNSSIVNQRVSNISRTTQSQVKQVLRFSYDDIDKMPQVLADIKDEIKAACPKLITDGSKPFAAFLSQYEADHIQTVVNCHFNIQPFSSEYVDAKEQVLLAINRAVSKNELKFAIPAIYYINS